MEWEFIVALALAIPIILFPAAFVWYLNLGGIYAAIKEARERRAVRLHKAKLTTESEQIVAMAVKERHFEKQLIGNKQ